MFSPFEQTLTFDDVLLVPGFSDVLPKDAVQATFLTNDIKLNAPFLSAPMDTVTEHRLAIKLALAGGMGIIHKNLSIADQVAEVATVKRFENGFIEDPVTVAPDESIARVIKIHEIYGYRKVPVVADGGILVGLITDADYFIRDKDVPVKERMVKRESLAVAMVGVTLMEANQMIREHRLYILCVLDDQGRLASIVTRRDIDKNEQFTNACKNDRKQLRVGAAVGVGAAGLGRAEALIAAGVDVVVVDTAHGHSSGVLSMVRELKARFPDQAVIAGNIATDDAARALVEAGVDAVKVGIGPGSICTTRIIAGIGVPQLSAVMSAVRGVKASGRIVPVISDGGVRSSGDAVKALAAGASAVMMGNMFAGTDETPGRVEYMNGRMYKVYRGMGSLEAMEAGSKDRYGQANIQEKKKLVPEGVSGRVPYKGPVSQILYQLAGGVASGMGYCGARTIAELQAKAHFIRITNAGLKESHPHDLGQMDEAPNYEAR